jgi:hypothetical protein
MVDLLQIDLDNRLGLLQLSGRQTPIFRQMHRWREPELGLTIGMLDMNMNPGLFAREEK